MSVKNIRDIHAKNKKQPLLLKVQIRAMSQKYAVLAKTQSTDYVLRKLK